METTVDDIMFNTSKAFAIPEFPLLLALSWYLEKMKELFLRILFGIDYTINAVNIISSVADDGECEDPDGETFYHKAWDKVWELQFDLSQEWV